MLPVAILSTGSELMYYVGPPRLRTLFLILLLHNNYHELPVEGLHERTKYIDIFLFSAHQLCSVSDVLFTGGRQMSDFSV